VTSPLPHILLITTDEQRKDALSCYGNQAISTPNIDWIARSGIQFNQAYTVSPWCLPARCSILTGLFPHNSGAYSNFRKCPLNNGLPNLFTELKKQDYTTALIGKCHFAPVPYGETRPDVTLPYDEFKQYYLSLGIDHLDLQDDKQVSVWFYDDYAKDLDQAGYLKAYRDAVWDKSKAKVFPFPAPAEWHPDAWVGRKAVEQIEKTSEDQPNFTWVSFSGPHYPFDTPQEYTEKVDTLKDPGMRIYDGEFDEITRIHHGSYHGGGRIDGCGMAKDRACKNYDAEYWARLRRSYLGNMVLIDQQVGMILDAAKQKFGEHVLIIFTADHGEMLGNHGIWGKHNCGYEDVWGIPLLVKYPGEKHGYQTEARVMLTDILPTCLKSAGAEIIPCDGIDFLENIQRGGYPYVFAEGEGYIAVSDGAVKYIKIEKKGEVFEELIDLSVDPLEIKNQIHEEKYFPKKIELQNEIIGLFLKNLLP
jgi:arylsulfatase A-like enzyme